MDSQKREERIQELVSEISAKRAELKALRTDGRLSYDLYDQYRANEYRPYDLRRALSSDLRGLALHMIGLSDQNLDVYGQRYITIKKRTLKQLSDDECALCNRFLEDLYPIISKYADIVLQKDEGR